MPQNDPIINLAGTPPPQAPSGTNTSTPSTDAGDSIASLISQVDAGLKSQPSKGIAPEFYTANQIDNTGRYPWYMPGADNENAYGEAQSWISKAGHSIWKGLNTAGTTFLQGTAGAVAGVYKMVDDGRLASFYDNDFNRSLDAYNKRLENSSPNYYTNKERDANWYSPSNLLTANFFWDKIVKNLGFSAGAFASGYAWTKALGMLGSLAKLSSAGAAGELANTLEDALPKVAAPDRLAKAEETIKGISDKYNSKTKYDLFSQPDRLMISTLGTIGEAGMESLQNMNQFRDQLVKDYTEKNGIRPIGTELDKINEQADHVGNWSFASNVALLSATNYIQLPKILSSSYAAEKAIANSIETNAIVHDAETGLFRGTKGFEKVLEKAKHIGQYTFAGSEAFEEGAQNVIQVGTQNYYKKKYQGKDANFLDDALGYGITQTLTTKDGIEQILIGGISGALQEAGIHNLAYEGKFGGNIRERKERNENTEKAIAAFNAYGFSKFTRESVDAVNRGIALQKEREGYVRQGDILNAKDVERDFQFNYLMPRLKYGRADLVKADLDQARTLASTPEGFAQLQKEGKASESDTRESFLARLSNFQEHLNSTTTLMKSLNSRFGGLVDRNGNKLYQDDVIEKMLYAGSKVADYETRMPLVEGQLINHGIDVRQSLQNDEAWQNTNKQIDDLQILDTEKDDLKQSLNDYREMNNRRAQFLKEYSDLKQSPFKFEEKRDAEGNIINEQGEKKRSVNSDTSSYDTQSRKKFNSDKRTHEQLTAEYGKGNQSQRNTLQKVIDSPYATLREKELARQFLAITPEEQKIFLGDRQLPSAGVSDGTTARINFEDSSSDYENGKMPVEHVLLHEIGHNFTLNQLRTNPEYRQSVQSLLDAAKAHDPANNLYGLSNVEEFATEALSNRKFQLYLGSIPYKNTTKTAWQEFISFLKNFIGKALGIKEDTLLDEAVGVITNNIDNTNADVREKLAKEELERETFRKNKELHDKIDQELAEMQKQVGAFVNSSSDIPESDGSAAKNIEKLFRSTTSPSEDLKPHHVREQSLLNRAKTWAKTARNALRTTLVTVNTEEALGLKGLIQKMGGDANTIAAVYTIEKAGEQYLVDEDGNILNKLGEQADLDKAIYTTMATDSLSNLSGAKRYGKGTDAQAQAEQKGWQDGRRTILGWKGATTQSFPFAISRGIPIQQEKTADGKPIRNNVIETGLASDKDISKEGLIKISTTGFIEHQGDLVAIPVGRAVLQNGDTLVYLNNRQFTNEQADALYDVLHQFIRDITSGKKSPKLARYLQAVLSFGKPLDISTATKSQLWLDGGKLFLGTGESFYYSPIEFEANENRIKNFLRQAYQNVNNDRLSSENNSKQFEEILGIKDGQPIIRKWKNYQQFLLSPTTERPSPPLTTTIRPLNLKANPDDVNFKQKYATLQGDLYTTPLIIETPKEEKKEEKGASIPVMITRQMEADLKGLGYSQQEIDKLTPVQANTILTNKTKNTPAGAKIVAGFVLDGKTVNTTTIFGHPLEFIASKQGGIFEITLRPISKELVAEIASSKHPMVAKMFDEDMSAKENAEQFAEAIIDAKLQLQEKEIPVAPKASSKPVVPATVVEAKDETDAQKKFRELVEKAKNQPPVEDNEFRAMLSGDYTPADIDAERQWFSERFNIPFNVVSNIIKMGGGGEAFGKFQNAAVYIWKNAETGTTYHEAFEAVWHMFTSLEEKQNILNEFRNREGVFTDRVTGEKIKFSEASDHLAKEQIAEEFRDYIMNEQKPKGNFLQRMFKQLLSFIQGIIGGNDIQRMFLRINKGFYKTASPLNTQEIGAQYRERIPEFNAQTTRAVVEGVTARVFNEIFKDNSKSLIDFDENNSVEDIYGRVYTSLQNWFEIGVPQTYADDPELGVRYLGVWENIQNNWPAVKSLVNEYLRTFGIVAKLANDDTDSIDNNNTEGNLNNRDSDDSTNRAEYDRDAFAYDGKKNAPASVKLLFGTLSETVGQNKGMAMPILARDPTTSLEKQVKLTKTFNQVLANLLSFNTLEEKRQALSELAAKFPNLRRLYNRLKFNVSDVSIQDWRLRVRLFNVLSKQEPEALINYIREDGSTYTGAADLADSADMLVTKWVEGFKTLALDKNTFISVDEQGNYRFKSDSIAKLKPSDVSNDEGAIKFLATLGIDFNQGTINALSTKDKSDFKKAVAGLFTYLKKADSLYVKDGRSLKVDKRLKALALASLKGQGEDWNSTSINISGEKVQKYILPNYISNIVNDINNSKDVNDLHDKLPQFAHSPYSQNSIYLNAGMLFNSEGEKTDNKLQIKYIQGTKDLRKSNRPNIPTDQLNPAQRLMQEINQNLYKNYYILVPADGKTEWMLGMDHAIPFETFENPSEAWQPIFDVFDKYYETEKALFAQDGKERLLGFISNGYTDTDVHSGLRDFISKNVDETISFLNSYGVIKGNEEEGYSLDGLDSHYGEIYGIEKMTRQELENFISFRTINYIINNVEMHKIFFGDPAEYKDATKRYKSFLSPREASFYGSEEYNNQATESFNNTGAIQLQEGDFGYHVFKDSMDVAIAHDVTSSSLIINDEHLSKELREAYSESNGADAQSWATLTGYREIWKRAGDRWLDSHEKQYQYIMANDRQLMLKDGLLNAETYRPELQEADKQLVKKGNPHAAFFPVIKPIGSGLTTDLNPFLHKTSTVQLSYSAMRGTNLGKLYVKMMKENIHYTIVESGEKVGGRGMHSLYNEDGTFNDSPFDRDSNMPSVKGIPFRYYGIQVETNSNKNSVTRGSQLTKLAVLNLMSNGVPIDAKYSLDEWSKLSKSEKHNASPVYEEIQRNMSILRQMTDNGYERLLKSFGIEDTGNGFVIKDKIRVAQLLQDELFRREASENLKDSLALNDQGEFDIALEATPNYLQIKAIIQSIVDRSIARPKVNGGQKVQVSGAMMEGVRQVIDYNGKPRLVSSALKFYEAKYDKDGKRISIAKMEIMLPSWVSAKLRKKGITISDEELIKKMTPEMLSGIGFRIPTQEKNSIESFIIKGFLPEYMGDTVVVPEEITTKAGSDFDVDKLSTYLKNIHVTNTGELHLVQYQGTEASTRAYYSKFFDDAIEEAKKITEKKLNSNEWKKNIVGDFDAGLLSEEDIEKYSSMLDELLEDVADSRDLSQALMDRAVKLGKKLEDLNDADKQQVFKEKFVDKMYKQSLENEYFKSLEKLTLLPQNFERLISPNTGGATLKKINTELQELLGNKEKYKGGILNPLFMSTTRHNFIVGKGGVSIAAVAQTNTAISQISNVFINPNADIPQSVRLWIGNGQILLPHNTIGRGGIQYATLSGILDQIGVYISSKVAEYLDGYVDIAKNPFIVELGATPALASTFLMLEKLGVPSRDVIMFMNQPIIREYMKQLANEQQTWLFDTNRVEKLQNLFAADDSDVMLSMSGLKQRNLASNIGAYTAAGENPNNLSSEQRADQQAILSEFLRYAMMARQLFELTQGSNYDTANFSDSWLLSKKQLMTEKASRNIFSSVNDVLNNTHIGTVSDRLLDSRDAIGQTILSMESVNARKYIKPVIDNLINRGMPDADFIKAARRVEQNFISFLVQTKSHLNAKAKRLLIDAGTSVAERVAALQKFGDPNSDLANNAFLKHITAVMADKISSTKTLRLAIKPSDAFTQDMITEGLRELKNVDGKLYRDILRAAFLQSGLSKNAFSYTDLLPYEDFAVVIQPLVKDLAITGENYNFADIGAFYRNNWANPNIVPIVEDEFIMDEDEILEYGPHAGLPYVKTNRLIRTNWVTPFFRANGIQEEDRYMPYKLHENSRNANSQYILVRRINNSLSLDEVDEMRARGDYSYRERILMKRVETAPGTALKTPYYVGASYNYHTYMPINAWGDGFRAEEHYNTLQPSIYDNGTYKPKKEFSDAEIIGAIYGTTDETPDNPIIPEDVKEEKSPSIVPVTRTETFQPIGTWKKSAKKSTFSILIGQNREQKEGYKIDFKDHPDLDIYVHKDGSNWTVSDNKSGYSITTFNNTLKGAVEQAVNVINNAANSSEKSVILKNLGVSLVEARFEEAMKNGEITQKCS